MSVADAGGGDVEHGGIGEESDAPYAGQGGDVAESGLSVVAGAGIDPYFVSLQDIHASVPLRE